jgi:hypothetical protein
MLRLFKVNGVVMMLLFRMSLVCTGLLTTVVSLQAQERASERLLVLIAKEKYNKECCVGEEGHRGRRGRRGHRGPHGIPGPGIPGAQGATGPTGATGATGSAIANPAYFSTRAIISGGPVAPNAPFSFDPNPPLTYGTPNITIDFLGQTITVLESGDYDISYFASAVLASGVLNEIGLTVNGVLVPFSPALELITGVGFDGLAGEIVLSLAANDQIQLINAGPSPILAAGAVFNYLVMNRVS